MKVSLIVTTYNWKEALEAVLNSVRQQSMLPDEVIVADDGSRTDTKDLIDRLASQFPIPLIHSWQKDDGFRAAESRNRAMAKASGDYLIIIDGDIVLPSFFIEDHVKSARKGYFIQGGRVQMNDALSKRVMQTGELPGLFSSGVKNRKNMIHSPLLSRVFTRVWNSDRSTRSCNMSFWREDALTVNGFNNDFVGWGREDSEFVNRLLNAGVERLYLKFMGAGYHLFHNENSRASLPENDRIFSDTVNNKRVRCINGIEKFLNHE